MTIFQLLRTPLIGETPFAMTSFVQMAAYPNDGPADIVAHPGSAAGLSGAILRGTIWNKYKQETRHISLSFRLIVARSLGWIGRVCTVTHLVLNEGWR